MREENGRRNDRNMNKYELPDAVKKLAKMSPEKFKKKNKKYFDSKKDLKRAYYDTIIDQLPKAFHTLVYYGNRPEVRDVQQDIYNKLLDPILVKKLTKMIDKGEEIDNIELLPLIVFNINNQAHRVYEERKKANPDENITPPDEALADIINLCKMILKKPMKKYIGAGMSEGLAFDILCVFPTKELWGNSRVYRVSMLFSVLYAHAKTEEIPFEKVIKKVVPEEHLSSVVLFCMLERKEKYANFNDGQKAFFNQISEWVFNTLEDMDKDTIMNVIRSYVRSRQSDEKRGKDGNRRFFLSSLPESDYPKINKAMQKLISMDETVKKYF